MTYQAIFESTKPGSVWAYVPDLPGCTSWGATLDEARRNVGEAIELWITTTLARGGAVPSPSTIAALPIDVPAA